MPEECLRMPSYARADITELRSAVIHVGLPTDVREEE